MTDLPPYDQLLAQARAVAAEVRTSEIAPAPEVPNLRWRNTAIMGGTAAVIGAVGYALWWKDEGFTSDFRRKNEGWFGRSSEFSGIDKLGHAYFAYAASKNLAPVFQGVGNDPETARRLSALTIWGAMGMVEVLDGYSRDYTFSHEDLIANTVGAGMGYLMDKYPELDDLVDFRLQYRQTRLSGWNPPGDYAGQRYWLMFKADGIQALRDVPVVKYLEAGVGYGAPGVDIPDEWVFHDWALRRREVFFGVSVNMSRVIADAFYGGKRGSTRVQRIGDRVLDLWQHHAIAYRGRDLDRHIPPPVCCTWPPPPR